MDAFASGCTEMFPRIDDPRIDDDNMVQDRTIWVDHRAILGSRGWMAIHGPMGGDSGVSLIPRQCIDQSSRLGAALPSRPSPVSDGSGSGISCRQPINKP